MKFRISDIDIQHDYKIKKFRKEVVQVAE